VLKQIIPLWIVVATWVGANPNPLTRLGDGTDAGPVGKFENGKFALTGEDMVVFVGQENLVRDQKSGELEALLASAFKNEKPRFRSMAWEADTVYQQWRDLHFGSWEEQLKAAGATVIIAQFGQMEALDGVERLAEFTSAYHRLLDQFATRTSKVVLLSPMPFEKPEAPFAPDLTKRNGEVAAYAEAVGKIASQRGAVFVDLYSGLNNHGERLTNNGVHLHEAGLSSVAQVIGKSLVPSVEHSNRDVLKKAIIQKNQLWFDCWRPANWSFAYGDRVNQMFGKGGGIQPTLHDAFQKQHKYVELADQRIHGIALGEGAGLLSSPKDPVAHSETKAMSPKEQMATFSLAEGYQVNLFASEELGVVNPTQIAWDEKGRLYVACSPGYPQSLASEKPRDYILVCEDTNGDGKADRSWKFSEGLTMVQGVEPGGGGVYVCDFDRLLHFRDINGDGKADEKSVVFSGFGVGDTHQLINSICHGPDGSLWFSQGLHAMSRVETPWGISRLDRAAIWRLRPKSLRLEGFFGGGMAGANCWGVAFDDYGQVFHKSGDRPQGYWSVPGMVRGASSSGSGSETEASVSYRNSPEQYHSVGPLFNTSPKTTSLDIIGTKALPDEIQGCALIGGYFGSLVELHRFEDSGSGFKTTQLPRVMTSSNNAFRPVDVSVGPDGAIYLADWYNPIIGHYQASYADPKRDKTHGRIWRISSKNHQPVKQPNLAAMSEAELLEQLSSPERWTRYQAKRLLFEKPREAVLVAADAMVSKVENEPQLLEICGVYEAHESPREELIKRLLSSKDYRIRAYGARVAGMWSGRLAMARESLELSVKDVHPRVRLESAVAASYLPGSDGVSVVTSTLDQPLDGFLDYAIRLSARSMQDKWVPLWDKNQLALGSEKQRDYLKSLRGEKPKPKNPGEEVYEMSCLSCHQADRKGLPGIYPSLVDNEWINGDEEVLIKVILHGLTGPINVAGEDYGAKSDSVPMPPMGGLKDEQVAAVLNYLRGNDGVSVEDVTKVRKANVSRSKSWTAEELGK
jgi:putative membrane-bound dehydrogenase-like protein